MIFYVLLSYGRKPDGSIRNHPAAAAQMRLFDDVVEHYKPKEDKRFFDYARRVTGIASLPKLQAFMIALSERGNGTVSIDDLSRIFRICPWNMRNQLLDDLLVFKAHLHSITHRKALIDFSDTEIKNLIIHPEKSKSLARTRGNRDSSTARKSSMKVRREKALQKAEALKRLEDRLLEANTNVSWRMIAEAANAAGLRTTRGQLWTASNVARTMERKGGTPFRKH